MSLGERVRQGIRRRIKERNKMNDEQNFQVDKNIACIDKKRWH